MTNTPIQPRGPASNPIYPASTDPSNPYNFTPQLQKANLLPPKETDKYIFFFGYEGPSPYVALQQWFPSPFTAPLNPYSFHTSASTSTTNSNPEEETTTFPTTEHYMMYHKALLMGDNEIATQILNENNSHPSVAKRLGREVKNFDVEVWKRNADRVVEEGNWCKFSQNFDLKDVLVGTGDRVLVEASPDDKIWGIGFNSEDAEGREDEWGNNGLGKALMKVRQRLRQGEK